MSEITYERVQANLTQLKLLRMAALVDAVAEEAANHEWTYLAFLDRLLDLETAARFRTGCGHEDQAGPLPLPQVPRRFRLFLQPSINERQIRELATMRFLAHGENVLLLGPPGVGKTHLAIALGTAAIAQRNHVYFLTMVDLIEMLHRDAKEDRLGHRLRTLCKPKLLILDEMGYFPLDRMAAQFLFQLVSRRYRRGSIILTSNKSFGEWGDVFSDHVLATAILDRLLHFSTTINIRGHSYRLREKRKAGVFHDLTATRRGGPD